MVGCLKGCVGKGLSLLLLLLAAGWAGWKWGPDIVPEVERFLGGSEAEAEARPAPSREIAESALDRVEMLRGGGGPERLLLGGVELSSVVRYSLPGVLPPGVVNPEVELQDGYVFLSAIVARDAFPDFPSLKEVLGILPDSVQIRMRGQILPFDDGFAQLRVDRLQAMKIPLPDRFVPEVLDALGRRDRKGLPEDALQVPLPEGVASAYVVQDSLVLVADR